MELRGKLLSQVIIIYGFNPITLNISPTGNIKLLISAALIINEAGVP